MVVEVLVAQGEAEDPLGEHGLCRWMTQIGLRGSGMAASKASTKPIAWTASRSKNAPASEVMVPPAKSATTAPREPRLEKTTGGELHLSCDGLASLRVRFCG